MADALDDISVADLANADTVLVINAEGGWKFVSREHTNQEVARELVRIGLAIEEATQ